MGYLNDNTGVMGGLLPAPHDSVRIVVGPLDNDRLFVAYEGTRAALLKAGAIDALMAATMQSATSGRDLKLRPFTLESISDGVIKVTRTMASIKNADDLPGLRGIAMPISPLLRKKPRLKLISS